MNYKYNKTITRVFGEPEERLKNNVWMHNGNNVWSQVMPIPYIETLSWVLVWARITSKNVSGITSNVQCIQIGNEHDLALDVIPESGITSED